MGKFIGTTGLLYLWNKVKSIVPTKVSDLDNDSGFTSNVGTITGVTMNGTSKGTSGVVNLGTVITEHQDISGKANSADLATVATSGSYNDLSDKPIIPSAVNLDGDNYIEIVGGSRLPYGYTPLDYIQTSGTQYIDTGIKGNMSYTYELDFQQVTTVQYRIWGVFGQSDYLGLNMSLTYGNGWMVRWESRSGQQAIINLQAIDVNRHNLIIQNGAIYFDGVSKGKSGGHQDNFVINYNLFLGTVNPANTTPSFNAKVKLYSYKVWDTNNTLIQSLIPAKRNTDNALGMYDVVNDAFLTNSGTGAFISGNVITSTSTIIRIGGGTSSQFLKADGSVDSHTYLTSYTETDPTVPSWAKASTKPSYTASEVGALPDDTQLFSGDYNDLTNKPTIPSAVTESTVSGWGFTKNTGTVTYTEDT